MPFQWEIWEMGNVLTHHLSLSTHHALTQHSVLSTQYSSLITQHSSLFFHHFSSTASHFRELDARSMASMTLWFRTPSAKLGLGSFCSATALSRSRTV